MVSMRLLVIGAYLLQLPCHANSGHAFSGHAITGHAKSLRAQLIDAGIIKLKNTNIIVPKKQPAKDQAKAKFFKQFDDNVDYHSEGLGQRRMDVQFFAYLSGQRLLRRFRPIKFNKIIENAGKCYKIATGIFEAPVAGRYSFTLSCLHGFNAHLVVNGHRIRAEDSSSSSGRRNETYYVRIRRDAAVWVEPVRAAVSRYDRAVVFSGKLLIAL